MPKVGRQTRMNKAQWRGGPRSKPTATKKLQGTLRADRTNAAEPKAPVAVPDRPEWLKDKVSQGLWRELSYLLVGMRVLTVADRAALALLCSTYAEWRRANEIIRTQGFSYPVTTREGETVYRKRPECEILASSGERLRRLLIEFGLTPSSRVKVHAIGADGQPTEDQLDAELFGTN